MLENLLEKNLKINEKNRTSVLKIAYILVSADKGSFSQSLVIWKSLWNAVFRGYIMFFYNKKYVSFLTE